MQSKSSKRWLKEHFKDPYVKRAKAQGLRSRAFFKLQELQERYRLFKPGMTIIDVGAAPGGWSEYLAQCLKKQGHLLAIDILPMPSIPGVDWLQGDFTDETIRQALCNKLQGKKVDWVVSDIAPNLTGIDHVDQARSMVLVEAVLEFSLLVLGEEGGLVIKAFQGEGFESFLAEMRRHFKKVIIRKPKASRGRSREVYILAKKTNL